MVLWYWNTISAPELSPKTLKGTFLNENDSQMTANINPSLNVYAHASEYNSTKLEDCYNLKEVYKQDEYTDPDINNISTWKNLETELRIKK